MKPRRSHQTNQALTLIELLVVLFVVFIFAAMLIPAGHNPRKAPQISCFNNLKQIGLAYRVWAGDHEDLYPMQVSITNGGVKELFENGSPFSRFVCLNYLVMSNELTTTKLLICPADLHATMATNFNLDFNNANLSYFAAPNADQQFPQMFLSGDDNFTINGTPVSPGLLEPATNNLITWTEDRHVKAGNIGLADGSAQQLTQLGLQRAGVNTNRLAIP